MPQLNPTQPTARPLTKIGVGTTSFMVGPAGLLQRVEDHPAGFVGDVHRPLG